MCSSGLLVGAFFFFQAEDGIRDLVRSRGLGDVYKRQAQGWAPAGDRGVAMLDGAVRTFGAPSPDGAWVVLSLIHI